MPYKQFYKLQHLMKQVLCINGYISRFIKKRINIICVGKKYIRGCRHLN